ncbi:MAG: hypothetical protein LBU37_02560 [Tannerellaceae bacterium]|nr:hypothetical protein [Tannerellaceae bacterium]
MTDTTDVTSENKDMMILQAGLGFSKFSSYRAMPIDSLIIASSTDSCAHGFGTVYFELKQTRHVSERKSIR